MWQDIRGHDSIVERFRRTLVRGRLASTYLFVGPNGVGKRTFALRLAKSLLCSKAADAELAPCGQCESRVLFAAGNHPDLYFVNRLPGEQGLRLKQFIGENDQRGKVGLCHDISLRPILSGRKVAIIDDADDLERNKQEMANCLLKTLEEPPPRSLIILLGTSLAKQLPTIRSRSQVVRFAPLRWEDVSEVLQERGIASDIRAAQKLAQRSGGSIEAAIAAQDQALWEFREQFLERLSAPRLDEVRLSKAVGEFVTEAGSAAPPRRARLRHVIGFAVELFRRYLQAILAGENQPEIHDLHLQQSLDRLVSKRTSMEQALSSLQACLEAEEYVLRNANQATLIQWWLAELAEILATTGGKSRGSPNLPILAGVLILYPLSSEEWSVDMVLTWA